MFGGGKSERLDRSTRQISFGIDGVRAAVDERVEKITYERAKARAPRPTSAEVFAHVPVSEVVEVVPGGYASAGLIASILIGKYVNHLPLYRQEQMSTRWVATIGRRSMCDWVEDAAMWLELTAGNYLQPDETPGSM